MTEVLRKGKINSNTNLTIVDKKIYPVYNPLINKIKRNSIANLGPIFTEYKTLSQQNVIAILSKNKKVRMDIENIFHENLNILKKLKIIIIMHI